MADVSGKFFSAKKVRTGVSPSSPGVEVGETLPPVNPPGGALNSIGLTMPSAFNVANSPLTSNGSLDVTGAGTTAQYIRGDGSLENFPSLTGYVPYTGANQTVNLNTQQLQAGHTTLTTNGSTETLTINHTSGSGKAINVTKGGNNEGLYVNKTSGSGNAATIVGTLEATTLKKTGGTSSQFLKADGSVDSTTYQSTADKGQPNGYASLDGNGKVPLTQINDALIGNVNFQGLWNASTNTPTLVDPPSSGTKGYYYIVSTGGTFAGITFEVGDWIISNGTAWGKVDNTDAVSSVFGRTGNVVASNGDYNTSQVTESGNLYYTDARSRAALSFAAGSGAYNSGTGVITIPTNNNQITNGAGYITSAALAGYVQGSGSAGQVAYWSSGSNITGESNLFWDATNDRLGIGVNNPQTRLHINGELTFTEVGFNTVRLNQIVSSHSDGSSINNNLKFLVSDGSGNTAERFRINGAGNVIIQSGGTFTDNGARLQVSGTATFTSDITANRYRGVNSLVLNSYTTVNPSSNVYLYSPLNDRDAWIYLDSADPTSNWGIYHRQIDTAVSGLPGNSIAFVGGGDNTLQAYVHLISGDGYFRGSVTALNAILSGTGSAFADGLRINRNSNTNQYTVINHVGGATNIVSVDQSGNNIAEINFGRSINGSTISNSMVIDSSGNVGINTNSGFNQVSGTETTLKIVNSNAASLYLEVAGVKGYANYASSSGNLQWYDYTTGVQRMAILSSGNFYIGPTPSSDNGARLQVSGAATFSGGINPTKDAKNTYAIHIRGSFYGAPRLQLYDLAVDPNAFLGLGVDMSGASFEFSNYFPRTGGNGRWSVGSWAGDFGSGQYVSGYNEKLFINENAAQFNVALTVTGTATFSVAGTTNNILISSPTSATAYGLISFNGITTEGNYIGIAGGGGTDKSLFLQSGNGGDLIFRTGNGSSFPTRLTITSSGNVGIGVTPSTWQTIRRALQIGTYTSLHDVAGFTIFGNNTYNPSVNRYLNNGAASQYYQEGGNHIFETAPSGTAGNAITFTPQMRITTGGNVLIGTTTDVGAKLHVDGGKSLVRTTNSSWGQFGVANPNDGEVGIVWGAGGTGYPGITSTYTRQWIAGLSPFGTGTDRWSITNRTLGANTALTIRDDGDTGIGTSSPASRLHLYKAGDNWHFIIDGGTGQLRFGAEAGAGAVIQARTSGGTTRPLYLQRDGGNVGIGLNNPQSQLHMNGSLSFTEPGFNTVRIHKIEHFHSDGSSINNNLRFLVSDGAGSTAERMRINGAGNVYIGTTVAPLGPVQGRLEVLYNGLISYGMNMKTTHTDGVAISFTSSSGFQVGRIVSYSSSTSYFTSSDYRIKQDLKDFNGLDLINKIKTYDFEWATDKTRSYGVVAHELQEVINYAVHGQKDSEIMQGVDYSKLVPILIKSIQELKQEIDTLKN